MTAIRATFTSIWRRPTARIQASAYRQPRQYTSRPLTGASDAPHHDLPSFLAYASRTSLSPTSTVYVGTHYEYTVQQSLARFGLRVARTGGHGDRGIDLLGTWAVPGLPRAFPLRILVQCKALSRKAGPNLIRELEGAFAGAPARWKVEGEEAEVAAEAESVRQQDSGGAEEVGGADVEEAAVRTHDDGVKGASGTIALLVAPSLATKGVRDAMGRSRLPMAYSKVALDGRVEQMLWNKSAAVKGLEGLGVTARYIPRRVPVLRDDDAKGESLEQEIVLTWDGEIWEGFDGAPTGATAAGSKASSGV